MLLNRCAGPNMLPLPAAHAGHSPTPASRLPLPADQLQLAVERHEYAEAAHLLEAVQQLSSHFQSYVHIPKVAELKVGAGRWALGCMRGPPLPCGSKTCWIGMHPAGHVLVPLRRCSWLALYMLIVCPALPALPGPHDGAGEEPADQHAARV